MADEKRHRRSFVFPLLLIAAGCYILAYNLDWITWSPWDAISTLWPAILIALGLDIIFSRFHPMISFVVALLFLALLMLIVFMYEIQSPRKTLSENLVTKEVSVPLDGSTSGQIGIHFEAGKLRIGSLEPGNDGLVEGTARIPEQDTLRISDTRDEDHVDLTLWSGRVHRDPIRIMPPRSAFLRTWDLNICPDIPLVFKLNMDAAEGDIDLFATRVNDIDLEIDAGSITMELPSLVEEGKAVFTIDAGSLRLTVPDSCEASIRVDSDLSAVKVDEERFTRSGDTYVTAHYGDSGCRWNVLVDADITSLRIH